jgi:hypothetical protein
MNCNSRTTQYLESTANYDPHFQPENAYKNEQKAPKSVQKAPKSVQKVPKSVQKVLKSVQKGTRSETFFPFLRQKNSANLCNLWFDFAWFLDPLTI